MGHLSSQINAAIQSLQHCHAICSSMALTHCLEMGGAHARPQHLRLMLDCAALCAFTADALGARASFTADLRCCAPRSARPAKRTVKRLATWRIASAPAVNARYVAGRSPDRITGKSSTMPRGIRQAVAERRSAVVTGGKLAGSYDPAP